MSEPKTPKIDITFPKQTGPVSGITGMGVEVRLDGHLVQGLRSIDLRVAYDEVVCATLDVLAVPGDIEIPAGSVKYASDGSPLEPDGDGMVDVTHAGSKGGYRDWVQLLREETDANPWSDPALLAIGALGGAACAAAAIFGYLTW